MRPGALRLRSAAGHGQRMPATRGQWPLPEPPGHAQQSPRTRLIIGQPWRDGKLGYQPNTAIMEQTKGEFANAGFEFERNRCAVGSEGRELLMRIFPKEIPEAQRRSYLRIRQGADFARSKLSLPQVSLRLEPFGQNFFDERCDGPAIGLSSLLGRGFHVVRNPDRDRRSFCHECVCMQLTSILEVI